MDFKQYLEQQKLADYTIKTHINKVASYKQQYGNIGYDIDSILKKIDNEPTISTRKSMAGSLSKYLQKPQRRAKYIIRKRRL